MDRIFLLTYDFFRKRRLVFWLSLLGSFALFALIASRIKFEENITAFFPDGKGSENMAEVFSNLKVSDKLVVMFSSDGEDSQDGLYAASARLGELLGNESGVIDKYVEGVDQTSTKEALDFIYGNLPMFLDDADYARMDSLLTEENIDSQVLKVKLTLISPAGFAMRDILLKDPLGLGTGVLAKTADLNPATDYVIRDGHIFLPDGRTLLAFIEPVWSNGETGRNDELVNVIEDAVGKVSSEYQGIDIHYFGGAAMSVYNARQIKRDTYATSAVALLIIILFILAVFKSRSSVFLILCPVIYGGVFALAAVALIQNDISGIAVGAGSAIMGIALSYSIHILAHQNHVTDVRQLISEICGPLVIGSITTIGAFVGLLFTSSRLLQDFGLFAAFTLLGTMLFCLIFLPQFLRGQAHVREGRILAAIEKANAYPFEKNKWLLASLAVIFVVCVYFSSKVQFDSNMMNLTYWDPGQKEAEAILNPETDSKSKSVVFVSIGADEAAVFDSYARLNERLAGMRENGKILSYSDASEFLFSTDEQSERLEKWRSFWTEDRIARLTAGFTAASEKYGFAPSAFNGFFSLVKGEYAAKDWFGGGVQVPELIENWLGKSSRLDMLISQVKIDSENVDAVYSEFNDEPDVVIFDQSYFANKAAQNINNDFYLILFISSFLIFFVLWLSYGRIELALLSFLPMCISWVIIIGIMGLFGIQFNIVNIILSTFIFGMGDDFSIFILEGLLYKYRTGKTLIDSHKTAIFFSSFTMIVGIGALIFAGHPALHSIAIITILGMIAVVLVAYTVEPVIFDIFVTRPTSKGLSPYTFMSFLKDLWIYVPTVIGCVLVFLYLLILIPLPMSLKRKQEKVCRYLHVSCRAMVNLICGKRLAIRTGDGSDCRLSKFRPDAEPYIVTANHQSFLDIVLMLAIYPKVKFMVADWVVTSPMFGLFAKYFGYYRKSEGYDVLLPLIETDMNDGWSIVIFPEGHRSSDGEIKRYHKGAFYLSAMLHRQIRPVVFYGNDMIAPKGGELNMARALALTQYLPKMPVCGMDTYKHSCREAESAAREALRKLKNEFDVPSNPYFYRTLVSGFVYKGPVTENYVRIKALLENKYALFNELLPRRGVITDIGCGMGLADYMLSMYSPERQVIGFDYDADKIATASHCFMRHSLPNLSFAVGDVLSGEFLASLPQSDAFIISDVLHYIDENAQKALLAACASKLNAGGMILVRDGNTENREGQKLTALTEFFSVKLLGFNKGAKDLHFISESMLAGMASDCGLSLTRAGDVKITSNTLYLLKAEEAKS